MLIERDDPSRYRCDRFLAHQVEANKNDANICLSLSNDKLAEILVGRDDRSAEIRCPSENDVVADPGVSFRYVEYVVPVVPKEFNNRSLNAFIANQIQAASSEPG
jgi:hypothetical protein